MQRQHLSHDQVSEGTFVPVGSEETDLPLAQEQVELAQPEVADHLGEVLRRDSRRRIAFVVLLPLLPFVPLLLLEWLLDQEAWIRLCTNPVFVVLATALIGLEIPIFLLRPSRKARQASSQLAELEDVSAV